ncbi:beta-galactosidase-1-like protein 2 [Saccostrea echinata]|uniref:beta-galactosidase-1-like protein 2 n=1 Tax=Saccostrea echinata TaxID=191078 RepID=UPI002A815B08|nr:beta-galactosidase-1-like protein 2 [Saccostrea echinata]
MDTRLCTSACATAITFLLITTTSAQISDSPYVSNGSLTFQNRTFYLDGNPLHILSGSLHYFRVVPEYWWDRMRKMKACGLNTLTLYAPWNQHEPYPGSYNFKGILNLRRFINMAQRAGLYVIFRPGPYICSEWDFGGLPAWLLRDPDMKVRTNYHGYQSHVRRYFSRLIAEVSDLQYHRGGPIIAVQVENEFGSYSNDTKHLLFLKQILEENGIHELFFTSDGFYNYTEGLNGLDNAPFYTEALPTVNFQDIAQGEELFRKVEALSDDFPLMVTEYWSGWFDYWGGSHHTQSLNDFGSTLTAILNRSASINFYMFHGGTNFGFMSGANWDFEKNTLKTDVTSYDYDALLTEAGDITEKYRIARQIIHENIHGMPGREIPYDTPKEDFGYAGRVHIKHYMPLENILKIAQRIRMNKTVPMELIPLHPVDNDSFSGQMYGYILYRANITHGDNLTFTDFPRDRIEVFVDGNSVAILEGMVDNVNVNISLGQYSGAFPRERVLDILVENRGRVNFGIFGASVLDEQLKGLDNNCFLDGEVLDDVDIYPLEFDEDFYKRLKNQTEWESYNKQRDLPGFYRGHMFIAYTPLDSYLNMKGWTKGFVYVNGVNLGRYWNKGPQQTLFVPGPYLRQGFNEIIIFEQHMSHNRVIFQETYILDELDEENT